MKNSKYAKDGIVTLFLAKATHGVENTIENYVDPYECPPPKFLTEFTT